MKSNKHEKNDHFKNISILSDEKRKRIMKMLLENEKEMSFKMISERSGIKPTSLAYHLKVLLGGDLVEKDFANDPGRKDYTRYSITDIGRTTLEFYDTMDVLSDDENNRPAGTTHRSLSIIPMELGPRVIRIGD